MVDQSYTEMLLRTALSVAVPLYIHELRSVTPQQRETRARECARIMRDAGEAILFYVPGESGPGFNAVAEAIAALSFCPGGIDIFGLHFESGAAQL